ncbi:MAG TPA: CBS domain-containing protein [Jatrophihabitans sp.]|jgi:CBS domain-containing protein|nr:CBS domain-containing protein [Jatrophihabitans sp.]
MTKKVRDIVTGPPVRLSADHSVIDAAEAMRDQAIGDVLIADNNRFTGLATDRDLVIRVLADNLDPGHTRLRDICSTDVVTLGPDDDTERAVQLIRQGAIRRIPVIEGNRPVGVVSLGDLAIDQDQRSALAEISAAPPKQLAAERAQRQPRASTLPEGATDRHRHAARGPGMARLVRHQASLPAPCRSSTRSPARRSE